MTDIPWHIKGRDLWAFLFSRLDMLLRFPIWHEYRSCGAICARHDRCRLANAAP